MIITDDFVMLNFPKTGSTFAREALIRIYARRPRWLFQRLEGRGIARPRLREVMSPSDYAAHQPGFRDPHGTWRQIPHEHAGKPVMSIMRNPLTRYLSLYFYEFWKQTPPAPVEEIRARWPQFPDLSFAEYYELMHAHALGNYFGTARPAIELGLQTVQFIYMFAREPLEVLERIDDAYIDSGDFRDDFPDITFLHQEHLNSELKSFLAGLGVATADLDLIDRKAPANVADPGKAARQKEIFEESGVAPLIRQRDRLIFERFPEYAQAA